MPPIQSWKGGESMNEFSGIMPNPTYMTVISNESMTEAYKMGKHE